MINSNIDVQYINVILYISEYKKIKELEKTIVSDNTESVYNPYDNTIDFEYDRNLPILHEFLPNKVYSIFIAVKIINYEDEDSFDSSGFTYDIIKFKKRDITGEYDLDELKTTG